MATDIFGPLTTQLGTVGADAGTLIGAVAIAAVTLALVPAGVRFLKRAF